jgi:hypothetical protein
MTNAIRIGMGRAARFSPVWHLYRSLHFLSRCLAEPYVQATLARARREDAAFARSISPRLAVLNGPFKGMRYPEAASTGSTLVPKLLGSYERELHGLIAYTLNQPYTAIVDIGCAEGYYAVGLGMHLINAAIHAFDTDAGARNLCLQMARFNGVAERLVLRDLCDEQALLALKLGSRALVISDCEGYEAQLFTPTVAGFLSAHDVLIEVHDAHDSEVADRLRATFENTHHVMSIDSIEDRRKPRLYKLAELERYDPSTRRRLLNEGRGAIMEWLFMTAKTDARGQVATGSALAAAA